MKRLFSLFGSAATVIDMQREAIVARDRLLRVYEATILQHQRSMLDLATAFRVSIECPEIDLRDDLDAMIESLSDQIAQTEEHVVA